MALDSTITRKFDNGYVLVKIGSGNNEQKYYKLPEVNAEKFQSEYKKNQNKMSWISTGLMLSGIVVAITPVYIATRNITNKTIKMILGALAGILGGIGTSFISTKIEKNSHKNLMDKYKATEFDNTITNLPI